MKKLFLILLTVNILWLSSCHKSDTNSTTTSTSTTSSSGYNFRIVFVNPADFYSVIPKVGNAEVKLSAILFYMNNIRLEKPDGSTVALQDIMLIDNDLLIYDGTRTVDVARVGTKFNFNIPNQSYKSLKFQLGVPRKYNGDSNITNYNPNSFPKGHPLTLGMGMDWDTWKMYRNLRIEGQFDTTNNNSFNYPIKYHTGFDSLLRNVTLPINKTTNNITLQIDLTKFFNNSNNPISLPKERYTEMGRGVTSEGILGVKVTENLINAMSIQ